MRLRRALFGLFTVFVIYGTTIPFRFVGLSAVESKLARLKANPIVPADPSIGFSTPDLVQNLILFVPFGVLGVLASSANSRWGMRRVAIVTAWAAVLAVSVEGFQLLTRDRVTSLLDAGADTLGAFIGAIGANRLRPAAHHATRRLVASDWLRVGAIYPLLIATAVIAIATWVPFDATLDVGMIVPKARMLARDAWQYTGLYDEGIAFLHFACFAAALAAWLAQVGQANPVVKAAAVAVAAAFGLEASQIIIMSRMPGLEDVAVRAAGSLFGIGCWKASRHAATPRMWLGLFVAGTGVAVALQAMDASESIATHELYRRLYLRSYVRSSVPALNHFADVCLAFIPLGFATGHLLRSSTTVHRTMLTALTIAIAVRISVAILLMGTLAIVAPLSDLVPCLMGAGCGAWVATQGSALFDRTLRSWHIPRTADLS